MMPIIRDDQHFKNGREQSVFVISGRDLLRMTDIWLLSGCDDGVVERRAYVCVCVTKRGFGSFSSISRRLASNNPASVNIARSHSHSCTTSSSHRRLSVIGLSGPSRMKTTCSNTTHLPCVVQSNNVTLCNRRYTLRYST
jgi:hypothetical protein